MSTVLKDNTLKAAKKPKVSIEPIALKISKAESEVARLDKLIDDQRDKYNRLCGLVHASSEQLDKLSLENLEARSTVKLLKDEQLKEIKQCEGISTVKAKDVKDLQSMIMDKRSEFQQFMEAGPPSDPAQMQEVMHRCWNLFCEVADSSTGIIDKSPSGSSADDDEEFINAQQRELDARDVDGVDAMEQDGEASGEEESQQAAPSAPSAPVPMPMPYITPDMSDSEKLEQAQLYWQGPSPAQAAAVPKLRGSPRIRGQRDPCKSRDGSRTPRERPVRAE